MIHIYCALLELPPQACLHNATNLEKVINNYNECSVALYCPLPDGSKKKLPLDISDNGVMEGTGNFYVVD